jgi:catechol 2,3-dioxygenase-like lactoylglutathione lyase family enzyme
MTFKENVMSKKPIEYLNFRPNLPVHDMETAVAFYRDIIGLKPFHVDPDGSFALFKSDGAEMALVKSEAPAVQGAYLYVSDVQTLHQRCLEQGITMPYPLTRHPYGMHDFVVEDPDGHLIAIGQRVS